MYMFIRYAFLCLLISCVQFSSYGSDLVFKKHVGTALNKINLYPDSSYAKRAVTHYAEGSLFEILSESKRLHEDRDQKQTFKWFEVKAPDGKKGWIFGDGLAVMLSKDQIDSQLQSFHKKRINFNKGFENAVFWIASINGRDIAGKNAYRNPVYSEQYIVVTNAKGKSVHINVSGEGMHGSTELGMVNIIDITDDSISEIILEKKSRSTGGSLEHSNLEIYTFQAGSMMKVFEERLSLDYTAEQVSPALSKFIEIDHQTIRVAYMDYVRCQKVNRKSKTEPKGDLKERCLEYVTYMYVWDGNYYKPFYEESRVAPKGFVKYDHVRLLKEAKSTSSSLMTINKSDRLEVIRHHEEFVKVGGQKKVENYFLVKTANGTEGYVPASRLQFKDIEHQQVLSQYYSNPPISKNDWSLKMDFISVNPKSKDQSVSRD